MEKTQHQDLPQVSFAEFQQPSYEAWKEEAVATLKGAPFEKKLLSKTYEGLTLQPIYNQADAEPYAQRLDLPGTADYLRGTTTAGYLAEPWRIAQKADAADPQSANAILKEELLKGATAICFAPEEGLRLNNLADLETLLDGVYLGCCPLDVYAGATALPLLGLLLARAERIVDRPAEYSGCLGADPLGDLAQRGCSASSLPALYDQMAAALRFAETNLPNLQTIYIQGSVYHNGGANAVQELAATLATAIAYIDALLERGLTINQIARQIRFSYSLGANFFMEIAKLRAAKALWAQIIQAYGGDAEAQKISLSARNSAFTASVYDPYVNILRATTQAFSGVLGGVDSLQIAPFDEAVRPSTELSRRVARNLQVMFQNEFNLTSPIDPAGGSWYLETLTGQLAEAAWQALQKIEAAGGLAATLQSGTLQAEIAAVLQERFKKLASRADKAVGVNAYANTLEQKLMPEVAAAGSPAATKDESQIAPLEPCLPEIKVAFAGGATLCAVKRALKQGDALQATAIAPHRWTEQFEALRARSEAYQAKTGRPIRVFLANMGPIPQHKARADFATGFMEVAAFEVLKNDGFATVEAAVAAAKEAAPDAVVICSTDDTYPELVPPLATQLKAACPGVQVILAGLPAAELKASYDAAGIDQYIHIKANCLQILSDIQNAKGVEA